MSVMQNPDLEAVHFRSVLCSLYVEPCATLAALYVVCT